MKTILNPKQKEFLELLKNEKELAKIFYLTGGTALAEFYFHHRLSEDIDLFTKDDFNIAKIDAFINKVQNILQPKDVYRQRIYDRYAYNFHFQDQIVKVEFVRYEFDNLKKTHDFDRLMVNDLYDIAVNKFFTIFDRNEVKDFVDLFFVFKKFTLPQLIEGVNKKFQFKIDPIMIGGELLKVKNTKTMPKMIKPLTHEELVTFFENEAFKLQRDIFED